MIGRMIRAAKIDRSLFEEVEADRSAMGQALGVVVLVGLATAIGVSAGGFGAAVWGVVFGIVGWAIWAGFTYLVGTYVLGTPETHADWGQLARTLGFAQSPGLLRVFGIIPGVGEWILLPVLIWQLVAMVAAVQSALDYTSALRAFGVVVIAAIPYVLILGLLFGGGE